jgi:MATE family multidrug resistance protein
LAWPLVLAELGWMAMGIIDTIMVGRLPDSATSIGAVSLGGILFYTCTVFGGCLLLGLDTVVSQAYGAGRIADCHRSLVERSVPVRGAGAPLDDAQRGAWPPVCRASA